MVERARREISLKLGPLGETVIRRTYARPKPDGGQEDWYDICARVVNGNCNLVDERFIEPGEPEKLFHLMLTMQIIPAGRHLWATGIHKYRQFVNNCFVADFTEQFSKHFTYTFLRLMEGGGIGANYSNRFIHSNPDGGYWVPNTKVNLHFLCREDHPDIDIQLQQEYDGELPGNTLKALLSKKYPADYDGAENGNYLRVDDSREGWAEALEKLLELLFCGRGEVDFVVDVSNIRPYGAVIKGFGGKASGPAALVLMLYRINAMMSRLIGQPLRSLHYMEIDHRIAEAVISGGTRRSARMAMKWWEDEDIFEFIECKRDYRMHWTTNISVVVNNEFFRAIRNSKHPKHEWANRVLDATVEGMLRDGEPGFINASQCEVDEAPGATFYSTNPCVTEDTFVLTTEGIKQVKDLVNRPFEAVVEDGSYRSAGFFETGVKPVYEVITKEGSRIKVTGDHKLQVHGDEVDYWCPVLELQTDQELVISGTLNAATASNFAGLVELIATLGSKTADGAYFIWLPDDKPELAYHWKSVLNMIGVKSTINVNRRVSALSIRIDQSDVIKARRAYRSRREGRLFKTHINSWTERVKEVRYLGEERVYDCTVDVVHCYISNGFLSHNCGEIAMMRYPDMKSFDVCCLGHVNLAMVEDPVEAFRLMTRFLIRATFAELSDPLTRANVERNRRIGVGFLGFHEWLVAHGIRYSEASSNPWVARQLRKFREVVREEARRYAGQMRIPEPIKKTTVAPTGTINNIPGVTSGIQPLYAPFYIRRVRYSRSDDELKNLPPNVPIEDDQYASNTVVASYYCRDVMVDRLLQRYGEQAYEQVLSLIESQFDLDVSDFLRVQELVQREYADNAVSITININQEEQNPTRLKELLLLYLPKLKGVTLYPERSRPQSPLQRITREEYEQATGRYIGSYEEDCHSGACPVR